jgi:geranylgeranyl pyrophosphate synthase
MVNNSKVHSFVMLTLLISDRNRWPASVSRQTHDGQERFDNVSEPIIYSASSNVTRSDYVPLVNLIGIYFQIRDDYMNLQSDQYAVNKGFAEDLTEGKFSFPLVHAIRKDQSNRQIISMSLHFTVLDGSLTSIRRTSETTFNANDKTLRY